MLRLFRLSSFTVLNRKSILSITLLAAILTAGNVWAQARKTSISCTSDSDGNVTVSFRISGVGNGNLCVVSSGTYTANCACENGGGNCPSADNKQSSSEPVSNGQSFASTNGQISGSETLTAPNESSCTLTCPGGQTPILAELIEPSPISVEVFGPGTFSTSGGNCSPNLGANPVRTGSCTPRPQSIIFNKNCATLF